MKAKTEELPLNLKLFLIKINKLFLDKVFFILLLLFLPTQIGRHFFPDFSLVLGIRVDYLSLIVYFTDILLFLTIFFWGLRKRITFPHKLKNKFALCLFISIFLNLLFTINVYVSLYRLIKLSELFLIAYYVQKEKISLQSLTAFLSIGLVYSFIIALLQFFNKASLGGFFWYLGERAFSLYTPGIAKAEIFQNLILRPYATFPHPNVLAGFVVLVVPLIVYQYLSSMNKPAKIFYYLVFLCSQTTLLLALSRIVWVAGFFGLIFLCVFLRKLIKKKDLFLLIFPLLLLVGLFFNKVIGRFWSLANYADETIIQRYELVKAAQKMFTQNPLTGVGLGNFIIRLPAVSQYSRIHGYFQPVHNVLLLIAAETGIIGILTSLIAMIYIYRNIQKRPKNIKVVLLTIYWQIIILSLFDHYLATLQQTQLLSAILIGFMIKDNNHA